MTRCVGAIDAIDAVGGVVLTGGGAGGGGGGDGGGNDGGGGEVEGGGAGVESPPPPPPPPQATIAPVSIIRVSDARRFVMGPASVFLVGFECEAIMPAAALADNHGLELLRAFHISSSLAITGGFVTPADPYTGALRTEGEGANGRREATLNYS